MALQLGATFVARSFSGDKQQLVPIISAAIAHKGAAFIDVISPCIAFNNHAGSTKSFDFVREHNEAVNRLDFISSRMPIEVKQEPGTVELVEQHDGSKIALRKLRMLHQAGTLTDMRVPPGNRLEALKGARAGQHSIRINDQWRICFVWQKGGPSHVGIVDYHD